MRYAMHEREVAAADGVTRLFDADRGCSLFSQRTLRVSGASTGRVDEGSDEVLYVLSGRGRLTAAGSGHLLVPGTAAFVARGRTWSLEADGELVALSVLVHDPDDGRGEVAVLDLAAAEQRVATAGRQFVLGATPEVGCASATQFVGLIPPGRAPDHFHTYDEVIYVLEGEGMLEIDGEQSPLSPGACVHLPARVVHCLANTGDRDLRVLGVFRPAGSPAEAYYPDGTPAVAPTTREER